MKGPFVLFSSKKRKTRWNMYIEQIKATNTDDAPTM